MKFNVIKAINYLFVLIGIFMVASLFFPFMISWLFEYIDFNDLLYTSDMDLFGILFDICLWHFGIL
jgi:hypothetical protein